MWNLLHVRVALVAGVLLFSVDAHAATARTLAAPTARPIQVETLVTTRAPISAFRQDGGRIAWSVRPAYTPTVVWIRALSNGAMRPFVCDGETMNGGALRAFAGARALWDCSYTTEMWNEYWSLETAAFGDRFSRALEFQPSDCNTRGDTRVGPASGDGSTLVYAFVQRRCDYDAESEPVWAVAAAGLKRVRAGAAVQVPDVPAPALLDVSGNRVALAPAVVEADGRTDFAPAVDGAVEVRNASTGVLLTSVAPRGLARAIALSGETLAVLASSDGRKRIDRYDALSGELVGQTMVPTHVTAIDAAGNRIVYQAGRTIHVLNALSGRARRLLALRRHPLGLSIEGSRVAWAVNSGRTGRVRVLWLSSGRLAGRERVREAADFTTPAS